MPDITERSMQDRVDAAVAAGELDDEFLREYLSHLLVIWQELVKSMIRIIVLAVTAMVLFGVLAGKEVSQVTILSFKFSNVSFLELVIPVFVACASFRLFALGIDNYVFSEAYDSIMMRKFPKLYESDLYMFIAPPGSGPIFDSSRIKFLKSSRSSSLLRMFDSAQDAVVMFVPVAFEAIAYTYLFGSLKASNPFVWVSLSLSVSILVGVFIFSSAAEIK